MTTVICPSCGEDVFTITGWAATDHCPYCGRSLAIRRIGVEQTRETQSELTDDTQNAEVAIGLNPPQPSLARGRG